MPVPSDPTPEAKGPFLRITLEVQERDGAADDKNATIGSKKYVHTHFLGAGFPIRASDPKAAVLLGSQSAGAAAAEMFIKHYKDEL